MTEDIVLGGVGCSSSVGLLRRWGLGRPLLAGVFGLLAAPFRVL